VNKSFWVILVGVVVLMLGAFMIGGGKDDNSDVKFEGSPTEVVASDRVQGPETAAVTLIEFSDFECPACGNLYPVIEAAQEEFGDDLRVVFRHFPLTSLHPNANAAHRASEAAHAQGKFFEMHDLLYERQTTWAAQTSGLSTSEAIGLFESYAQQLGLNMDQYRDEVGSSELFDNITRHQDAGNQLNISATPTLLLNGELIDTPPDASAFFDTIQAAIDANTSDTTDNADEN